MRKIALIEWVLILAIAIIPQSILAQTQKNSHQMDVESSSFKLADQCPPSFIINEDGLCKLVSIYQFYSSPPGFGGLRVNLPTAHDGFKPQQIDLGRYLFFDPLLSGDKKTSCAHCHHPDYGYADGRAMSNGFGGDGYGPARKNGVELNRAAPTLWNSSFLRRFFWDWRATSLEEQAKGPLFADDEMGNQPAQLEADINGNKIYRDLFKQAFNLSPKESVKTEHIITALSAFEASLISLNSRYDRYAHGDHNALSVQEIEGHNIFRSFVTRCSQCHTPPLFTNGELAVTGAPEPEGKAFDPGAEKIFPGMALNGGFKIPTLRNISRTAPYMHSGALKNLEDVVSFYNDERGHAAPVDQELLIHWHMTNPGLRKSEEIALIAFLNTLDDESMAPRVPEIIPSGLAVVKVMKQ